MECSALEKSESSKSSLSEDQVMSSMWQRCVCTTQDENSPDHLAEDGTDNGPLLGTAPFLLKLHPCHQRLVVNVERVEVIVQETVIRNAVGVSCDAQMQQG